MNRKVSQLIARLAVEAVGIALVLGAFLRGNYLLGFGAGFMYAVAAGAFVRLCFQSFTATKKPPLWHAIVVVIVVLPIGYILTYPTFVNPELQHQINQQATARTVRAELRTVFSSDPAFARLSSSTRKLKAVPVTIYGSLPDRSALERLRSRIMAECETLSACPLLWDVTLRKTNQKIDGSDHSLFPSDEPASGG